MSDLKELVVALRADASKYTSGMKQAQGDNENFKKSTKSLGGTLASGIGSMLGFAGSIATGIGIANLAGDAVGFLKDSITGTISAAADSQAVMAQTNAGLASTHSISGMTAQSISDLAGKIQLLSGIDDEAVQTGENMLLTFTNIGGKIFPQATQAAADFATKMNGGAIPSAAQMQSASLLLGKALNDPVQGVTALQRAGVKLSATQMAQVKHFMAINDIADAQKIILGEVNKEMGGAAEAAGGTFAGKLATLQGVLQNVQEAIGGAVIPVLTALMAAVAPLVQSFANALPGALQTVGNLFKPIADAANMVWQAFQSGLKPAIAQLTLAFSFMQGPGDGVKGLFGQIGTALGKLAPTFKQLGGTVGTTVATAFKNLQPLLANLGSIFTQFAPILLDLGSHLFPLVGTIIQTVGGFIGGTLLPILSQLAGFVATNVMPVVKSLGDFLGKVADVIAQDVMPVVKNVANTIMTQFLPPLENIIKRILPPVNALLQFLGFILGNVIGPIIKGVIGPVLGLLVTILGKVLQAVGWVMDRLGELKDKVLVALQPVIKNVSSKLAELHSWFNDKVLPVIKQVHAFFNDKILPVLQQVGGFIRDQVVAHLHDLWDIIQSKVMPILGDLGGKLKDGIGKEFQTFGDTVHTVFGKVGDFLGKLGDLKDKIGDLMGKLGDLKDKFTSLKFEFPHINLPHFNWTGNFSVNPPSVPHLDVQWFKSGGIFTRPTIAGVGEAGPEAVIPLNRLSSMVDSNDSGRGGNGGNGNSSGQAVVLNIDGRAIARALLPHIVNEIRTSGAIRSL